MSLQLTNEPERLVAQKKAAALTHELTSRSTNAEAQIGADDPRYAAVLNKLFNKRFTARPDYVRLADSTADVLRAVQDAVNERRRLVVTSGGHCLEGFLCEPDVRVIVDVSPMSRIYFDSDRGAIAAPHAHAARVEVGDIDAPAAIHRHAERRRVVARGPARPECPVGSEPLDPVVVEVGDEDRSVGIDRDAGRAVELAGLRTGPPPRGDRGAIAGVCLDPVVVEVGEFAGNGGRCFIAAELRRLPHGERRRRLPEAGEHDIDAEVITVGRGLVEFDGERVGAGDERCGGKREGIPCGFVRAADIACRGRCLRQAAGGEIVACEACGDGDGGHENQKGIDMVRILPKGCRSSLKLKRP